MIFSNFIDLTFPIQEGMQTYPSPNHPFVEINQLARHGIENRETRKITLGTHTGTHIDAPRHFIKNGITVDQIPIENIFGNALLVDFSYVGEKYEIQLDELKKKINHRNFKKLLLRFDWCKFYGTEKYYTHLPFLSEECCKWLVNIKCELIGMDTPMPDDPKNNRNSNNDSPNHKILLSNNIIILEYLTNLKSIKKDEFFLMIGALNIVNADGSPSRVVAAY